MSTKKNVILVPIDFSDQSLIALDQSYNLAREYNAEITLLYVIEERGAALLRFFNNSQAYDNEYRKVVEQNLETLAKETETKSGIKTNVLIAHGHVYDKIVEISEMLKATFIIMGSNASKAGTKKRFIGSNALRVVRESSIPVITIKGKHHRNGCKSIVLPLDLTKETKEKVDKAIELAKYNGATIHVVSVQLSEDEFIVNKITRQIQQVKSFIEKAGVNCTAEVINGKENGKSLPENIIEYANKVDGDLLMIMTQQEVDYTSFFIGSAAQEIILNSDIPVLSIVPSTKKDTSVFTPY